MYFQKKFPVKWAGGLLKEYNKPERLLALYNYIV